jgi:hypothetical protein
VDVKCGHAVKKTKFVLMNCPFVLEQVQGGFEGQNKNKVN